MKLATTIPEQDAQRIPQELEFFDAETDPQEENNHLGEVALEDLPADFRSALEDTLSRSRQHDGKSYQFGGNLQRVFT